LIQSGPIALTGSLRATVTIASPAGFPATQQLRATVRIAESTKFLFSQAELQTEDVNLSAEVLPSDQFKFTAHLAVSLRLFGSSAIDQSIRIGSGAPEETKGASFSEAAPTARIAFSDGIGQSNEFVFTPPKHELGGELQTKSSAAMDARETRSVSIQASMIAVIVAAFVLLLLAVIILILIRKRRKETDGQFEFEMTYETERREVGGDPDGQGQDWEEDDLMDELDFGAFPQLSGEFQNPTTYTFEEKQAEESFW
jgi:hypothetical protein